MDKIGETSPLNMHQVTSIVLDAVPSFSYLNAPSKEMRERYLSSLAMGLQGSKLEGADLYGAYVHVYKSKSKEGTEYPIAVKVFSSQDATLFKDTAPERMEWMTDDEELQAVLDDKGYILFSYKPNASVKDLSVPEKTFVFLALEHLRNQEFYYPYVLPAVFVAFPAPHDIFANTEPLPDTPFFTGQMYRNMIRLGHRYKDRKRLIYQKGEILYTCVQNFEDMGPSVFNIPRSQLTEDQKAQLKDFKDKVKSVYDEFGYFPDPAMLGSRSSNLRFNSKGRLILIDTNHLLKKGPRVQDHPYDTIRTLELLSSK